MNWLVLAYLLRLGVCTTSDTAIGEWNENEAIYSIKECAYYTDIGLTANIIDRLIISGSVETYMNKGDGLLFRPFRSIYNIEAKFRFNDNLFLVASHFCDHPVWSGFRNDRIRYADETKFYIELIGSN